MNYIAHLNRALERFNRDKRLNPKHISLYMALFRQWNKERFPQWLYIRRKEIMQASRLGSTSTYHRIIKDLDRWGYLVYKPSFLVDPGSRVEMLQITEKGIPPGGQPTRGSSSPMGRPHPIGEQATMYNKHINKKEVFKEKNKALKIVFEKENLSEDSRIQFLKCLKATYSEVELVNINWTSLISIWKKEKQLPGTKAQMVASHRDGDHLKTQKSKRYDQPL